MLGPRWPLPTGRRPLRSFAARCRGPRLMCNVGRPVGRQDDVAAKAGVSPKTVSRVVNPEQHVSGCLRPGVAGHQRARLADLRFRPAYLRVGEDTRSTTRPRHVVHHPQGSEAQLPQPPSSFPPAAASVTAPRCQRRFVPAALRALHVDISFTGDRSAASRGKGEDMTRPSTGCTTSLDRPFHLSN